MDEFLNERGEELSGLISLKVDDEEIVVRLLDRGKTSGRADDASEAVIRKRIEVYNDQTAPVFNYYDDKGKAQEVEGVGTIDEIFNRLSSTIEAL